MTHDSGTNAPQSAEEGVIGARWNRLQALFNAAMNLPPQEQQALAAREAADDPELREELLDLLSRDNGNRTSPLTHALGSAIDLTTRDRRQALLGRVVANYRLTAVLGYGGTGTVYLAERADRQYSAQVAVKIIEGTTLNGVGARVRSERQILAGLNHPNIARLLDAGEIEDGRPYMVMEYVHGQPVDRFCDRTTARLDLRRRLELFLQICGAVQYAHQNLVVHRDLKPANILVTDAGEPKLLDFGIAKMLEAHPDMPALTRLNDRVLTPEYASPEQILGRNVTTASDVYALGMVLYELLSGLRPYVIPPDASQLDLEKLICVVDPPRPSAAVQKVIEANADNSPIKEIAAARLLSPERLCQRLQGDLDAIVMRALRKESESRYRSVEQLADDIRRYLNREPVQARQGNWVYYSQRFARRNAIGVSAASVFVVFLATFGIVMSVQRQRIAEERDRATQESERAERVSTFMLSVFTASDPYVNNGSEITASQLLERAAGTIKGELNEQPEVRARLLEAIGRAYRRQSQPQKAIDYLEESLRVRRQAELPENAQTGQVFTELAIALRNVGRFEESDRAFRTALRISSQGEADSIVRSRLLADLGRMELQRSNTGEAQKYFAEALAIARRVAGSNSQDAATLLLDTSSILLWRDDLDGAERTARESLAIFRDTVHEQHPDRVMANQRLAEVLLLKGKVDEAGPLYENALEAQRVLYGKNSSQVADTLDSLAQVRLAQNNIPEAEKLTREAIATNVLARGDDYYMNGYLQTSLGQILMRQNRNAEAEKSVRAALDLYARTLPADHQYVAAAEYVLGEILLATNRLPDAEAMLTASMNRWKRADAPSWRSARSASALGEALHREGQTREAEKYLVSSFRELAADSGVDAATRQKAHDRLAHFYEASGQRQKMEALSLELRNAGPDAARPN